MGNKGALESLLFAFYNKRVNVPFNLIFSPLLTVAGRRHLITSKNPFLALDASSVWMKSITTSLH